jgi:hypothetical protein
MQCNFCRAKIVIRFKWEKEKSAKISINRADFGSENQVARLLRNYSVVSFNRSTRS